MLQHDRAGMFVPACAEIAQWRGTVLIRLESMYRALLATFLLLTATPSTASPPADISADIRELLADSQLPDGQAVDIGPVRAFYEQRTYLPAWTGGVEARGRAQQMIAALLAADTDGLDPGSYQAKNPVLGEFPRTARSAAEFDILLTDGALRFARDLRLGRAELRSLDPDVDLPSQVFDPVASLDAAVESNSIAAFVANLPPPHPEYARLKRALASFREAVSHNDDAKDDSGVPLTERVMQIAANMERWRWLPRSFEPSYIEVNVPDERLVVMGSQGPVLESRVVVGRPGDPTPIFRAVATSVTVNPPWNVPEEIARREILPKLKRNPDYLLANDMILRDGPRNDPYGLHIDWNAMPAAAFRYHVQQRPGPKNALGMLKLELPNRFNVYLHYTSAESAFDRDSRALSHGCVRVEQILPLASYALTRDTKAAIASLQAAIATVATQHLSLSSPLAVYFLYWTAFVDENGVIQFRPDIYDRDARLIAAMQNRVANARVTTNAVQCQPA
ncbi:MAG TPA: L,D-transpeptidase family protein [Rhizomicrobium sp.]|nr:L,D-transpeptidase family protein [Rhizomicrobium sp.]